MRPFLDVNGGQWQVSVEGGRTPVWSRNGRDLFYLSSGNFVTGVTVEAAAGG